jgi:adenylyltransferase/sulfurtransferase
MRDPSESRYVRQERLAELGVAGQRRLLESHVAVVGCGALGSNLANLMVRAGVGRVRVMDRDVIELSNLPRQVLFDEGDVAAGLHKAEAAGRRLRLINSDVAVEALVRDVSAQNVEQLLEGVDLVLDGTDNLETRYLLNDACVKAGRPWIYGGVLGTTGMTMAVLPGDGPCLRCLFPEPPPPGSLPTCETQGVLGTAPALIAALQATEAIKLLAGGDATRQLLTINLWSQTVQQIKVLRDEACPTCAEHRFDFLDNSSQVDNSGRG